MKLFEPELTIDERKTIGEELFFQDCAFYSGQVNFDGRLYFIEAGTNDDEKFEPGKDCEIKVFSYYDNEEYWLLAAASTLPGPMQYKVIGKANDKYYKVALTERNPDYYTIIAMFMKAHEYEDWKFSFEKKEPAILEYLKSIPGAEYEKLWEMLKSDKSASTIYNWLRMHGVPACICAYLNRDMWKKYRWVYYSGEYLDDCISTLIRQVLYTHAFQKFYYKKWGVNELQEYLDSGGVLFVNNPFYK